MTGGVKDVTDPTEVPAAKPGWQTSEFWLSLASYVVAAITAVDLVPGGTTLAKAIAAIGLVLGSMGYSAARSFVKAAQLKAVGEQNKAVVISRGPMGQAIGPSR